MLADFGLAKHLKDKDYSDSFCGTQEYLSPEMLYGQGHSYPTDWWAVGILLYEILVGVPPFFHKNQYRMFFLIKESPCIFPDEKAYGIKISEKGKDLIQKLLTKNPAKRIGTKGGIQEILSHPFFEGIDYDQLINKKIQAPYKPKIDESLAFFDQSLVQKQEIMYSVVPTAQQKMIDNNKDMFRDFSAQSNL